MATEQRLVDALNAERPSCPETQYDVGYNNGLTMAVAIVRKLDVVEVVRCKACEYGCEDHEDAYLCNNGSNGLIGFTRGDDFCSYGERRADND